MKCIAFLFLILGSFSVHAQSDGTEIVAEGLCVGLRLVGVGGDYNASDYSRYMSNNLEFPSFLMNICQSGAPVRCVLDHLNDDKIAISSANQKLDFVKTHCRNETIECVTNLLGETDNRARPEQAAKTCESGITDTGFHV